MSGERFGDLVGKLSDGALRAMQQQVGDDDNPVAGWIGRVAEVELARRGGFDMGAVEALEVPADRVHASIAWLDVGAECMTEMAFAAPTRAACSDLIITAMLFDHLARWLERAGDPVQ